MPVVRPSPPGVLLYSLINGPRGRRYSALFLLLALVAGVLPLQFAPAPVSGPVSPAAVAIGGGGSALPRGARVLGPLPAATPMRLVVGLTPRHQDLLDALLRKQAGASALTRRVLSPEEYARLFSPTEADEGAVTDYLQAHGLRVVRHYRDRLLLDVEGTAGAVSAAFGTPIVRYRDRHGRARYGASARPRLPAALARLVTTVAGLRDDALLHHGPLPRFGTRAQRDASATRRARGIPPPPAALLTPARIRAAYGIAPLYTQVLTGTNGLTTTISITGNGQTIALYELSPFRPDDIAAYDAAFGITAPPPVSIPVDGGATDSYGDKGAQEAALDIELVRAVAPGARILVYNGPATQNSANTAAADDTYARIVNDDKAQILSTSWGQCEDEQQADQPPDLMLLHNLFEQAVAEGMTVVAASGDNGGYDCLNADGTAPDTTKATVDYPASDPYVIAVGGTRLALAADGGVASEEGWAGSGGGVSNVFARPAWQTGPGVDNALSNGKRQTPDVALDAGAGYAVWAGGGWLAAGGVGTSAAAPVWAAILALGNQLRYATAAAAGASPPSCATLPGLGDIHPELYQLGAGASGGAGSFRDIMVGSSNGIATPGPGWDYVTGLGVPDVAVLLHALVALPALAPPAAGACPAPPWTPTPPATRTLARLPTRTPVPRATPTSAAGATRPPSPTPPATSGGPRPQVRVVPAQVIAGGTALLELRGAGRALRVTFELDYPTQTQRVWGATDRYGAATVRVRVPRAPSQRRAVVVRLRATVQENRQPVVIQTNFIVLRPPSASH